MRAERLGARTFASVVGGSGVGLLVVAVAHAQWGPVDAAVAVLLLSFATRARSVWWSGSDEPSSWQVMEVSVAAAAVLLEPWSAIVVVSCGIGLGYLADVWPGDGNQRAAWDVVKFAFTVGSTALGVGAGVLLAPAATGSMGTMAVHAATVAAVYSVVNEALTQGVLARAEGIGWWRAVCRDARVTTLVSVAGIILGVGVALILQASPVRLLTAAAVAVLYVGLARIQREAFTASARLRALLGYAAAAHRYESRELIEEATLSAGRSLLRRDLRWGGAADGGFPVTLTDGTVRHLVLSPERNGQPRPFGVDEIQTMESLSSLAETALENELVRRGISARVDALSAGSELKSTVLQAVAHDLRSPLQAVLGFSATLRSNREQLSPEVAEHLVDRIHGAAWRMQRVIDTIVAVEELELGAAHPHTDLYDAAPVLAACLADIESTTSKDVAIDLDGVSPLPATLRPELLERVVTNLVGNAIKHAPPGTTVEVTSAADDARLVLHVADRGPGVLPAARDSIFAAFTQAGDERSRDGGLGLGLYIAARLTALADGQLDVDDRPGGGARFTVTLPAREGTTATSEAPARRATV